MAKRLSFYRPHKRVQEDGAIVHPYTGVSVVPPSRTKQEFKRECDINTILKQYSTTGMLTHVSARAAAGMYTDLPDAVDFQDSLHQVEAARQAFMSLPAKLRDRFGNEPAEFLAFCQDPANQAELLELGLATTSPNPPAPEPPAPAPQEEKPK